MEIREEERVTGRQDDREKLSVALLRMCGLYLKTWRLLQTRFVRMYVSHAGAALGRAEYTHRSLIFHVTEAIPGLACTAMDSFTTRHNGFVDSPIRDGDSIGEGDPLTP